MKTKRFTNPKVRRVTPCAPSGRFAHSRGPQRTARPTRRFALFAAAALFTHTAFAAKPGPPPPPLPTSGTVILDYQYSGPSSSAENFGVGVDSSGTIYSSGRAYSSALVDPAHGILLASNDGGNSWSLVDDSAMPGFAVQYSTKIISDAAGNLYVAGLYHDLSLGGEHWIVRRSSDAGATWTTVDDFDAGTDDSGQFPPTGIAVDAAGDVYVVGYSNPHVASTTHAWTVRKGVGGTSFSTVDLLATRGRPRAIFVHPTAGLLVAGDTAIVYRNQVSSAWMVRRSTNGGSTWSTIDVYQLSSGYNAAANDVAADALGNIYVVGSGNKASGGAVTTHWILRMSTNGGTSFGTVDDFGTSAKAQQFARTPNGDLFTAGSTLVYGGDNQVIVRKSAGGTGAWTTIDTFTRAGYWNTEARSMVANASGSLFLGIGSESGLWVVKKY
jgi:hypothetical protein